MMKHRGPKGHVMCVEMRGINALRPIVRCWNRRELDWIVNSLSNYYLQ